MTRVLIDSPTPGAPDTPDTTTTGPASVAPAGGESLADLAAEAGALDAPALPPGAPDPAVAAAQAAQMNTRAIVGLMKGGRAMLAPRFKWWGDFSGVWSDEQLESIAAALEAVRDHMGWDVSELMDTFGPWLLLAAAVGMPAYATWEAINERRELLAAQRRQQPAQVNQSGGG